MTIPSIRGEIMENVRKERERGDNPPRAIPKKK